MLFYSFSAMQQPVLILIMHPYFQHNGRENPKSLEAYENTPEPGVCTFNHLYQQKDAAESLQLQQMEVWDM